MRTFKLFICALAVAGMTILLQGSDCKGHHHTVQSSGSPDNSGDAISKTIVGAPKTSPGK